MHKFCQVAEVADVVPNQRACDFSFVRQAEQQLKVRLEAAVLLIVFGVG